MPRLKRVLKSPSPHFCLVLGVIVLLGLAWALPTLAFTEPTEAPPGGAVAAPLNVSSNTQTKAGKLILSGGLDMGIVGSPASICLFGSGASDCINKWSQVVSSGVVLLNNVATANPPLGAPIDSGFTSVQAKSVPVQRWAIGGQANSAVPVGNTIANDATFGLLGMAGVADQMSYGIYGWDAGLANAGAAYLRGRVIVSRNADQDRGRPNLEDTFAVYSNVAGLFGSSMYVEQQNVTNYAGYFSGRKKAIRADCSLAEPRCFQINVTLAEGGGGYLWQRFSRNDTAGNQWWIRSNTGPNDLDAASDYFGLDRVVVNAGDVETTTTPIFRFLRSGNVSFGSTGGVIATPNPKFLINAGVVNAGNANNAVDIIAQTSDTALYVQQQTVGKWAGYFSGKTGVYGGYLYVGSSAQPQKICLNDDGTGANCIAAWPAGGGPAESYWSRTAGGVIYPVTVGTDKLAIGGTDSTAPLYFDPRLNLISLNSGALQVSSGALVLNNKTGPGSGGGEKRPGAGLRLPVAYASTVTGSFDRLVAKGGTITVDYSGSGNDKLELGNAGRDIASSGDLYFRPSALPAADSMRLWNDGGKAKVSAPQGEFSISKNAPVLYARNSLGGPLNTAAAAGLFWNSDPTSVAPALISMNMGLGDALQGKVFGAGNAATAVYGENASASGYAGYFSGRAFVISNNGVALQVSDNANDAALLSQTTNAAGRAADFKGQVRVLKFAGSSGLQVGALGAGNAVALCLYGTGAEVCKSSWPDREGSMGDPTSYWFKELFATPYLRPRENANDRVYIGYDAVGWPNPGADQTALSVYNNSANSTIYSQQANNSGWAGYFNGGLAVMGGITALGAGTPPGDELRLGVPGTGGVAWDFIEAENWDTGALLPCVDKNFADNTASNGRFVNIVPGDCAGQRPTKYESNHAVTITNLPPGTYKLVVRMKAAHNDFISDAVEIGVNGIGRTIAGTEFSGAAANTWITLDYTFNVNANGQDIRPYIWGTRWNDVGVDWLMIVPADETPKLLHGTKTLTDPPVAIPVAFNDMGITIPTGTYDCEAAVDEVAGNHASGFGCRISGGQLQAYVSPAGTKITCSYTCWPK